MIPTAINGPKEKNRTSPEEKKELYDRYYMSKEIDFDKDIKGENIVEWRYGKAPKAEVVESSIHKANPEYRWHKWDKPDEVGSFASDNLKEKTRKKILLRGKVSGKGRRR
jgi:hypothetical protein